MTLTYELYCNESSLALRILDILVELDSRQPKLAESLSVTHVQIPAELLAKITNNPILSSNIRENLTSKQ